MSPRAAAVLLTRALGRLDALQPPEVREPVRHMLNAAIEMCVISRSLLGKPTVHVIRLAQVIADIETSGESGEH